MTFLSAPLTAPPRGPETTCLRLQSAAAGAGFGTPSA